MSTNWSQQYTRYFIELWAQHPILNMVTARDSTNRSKKMRAMEEILRDLNAMGDTKFTMDDIRRKIHGLRTQYQKERSLIQQSIDNGATGKDVYVPKLWTYNLLHFICDNERAVSEYKSKTKPSTSRVNTCNYTLSKCTYRYITIYGIHYRLQTNYQLKQQQIH